MSCGTFAPEDGAGGAATWFCSTFWAGPDAGGTPLLVTVSLGRDGVVDVGGFDCTTALVVSVAMDGR